MTNPLAQDLGGVVLLPCPFCGGHAVVDASSRSDERSGYNFSVHIACVPCHVKLTIASGYDKNGWCNESLASVTSRAIAAWNTRAHSAEIAGALEQLRDLHDSIRTVYDAVPALPITADTMDAATDALHAFCLLVGIHRVDVGDPQPPATQQGGGVRGRD